MPHIKKTIQTKCSLDTVWNLLTDPTNFPQWELNLSQVITLGQGVGARIDMEYDDTLRAAYVSRYVEPERYAYQYNHWITTWEVRYTLSQAGQETLIERRRVAKGIPGWVLWFRNKAHVNEEERQIILRLKAFLDQQVSL